MNKSAGDLLLQNKILHDEIKRRIEQITAINSVATTVSHSLDLSITLKTALDAVNSVVGTEASGISLIDPDTGDVVLRAQSGWIQDFVERNPMRVPAGEGLSGKVIRADKTFVYNDMNGEEEYAVPSFKDEAFRAMAMAPMHARGEIIGILSIMSHQANVFTDEVVDVLNAIADTVGVAIDNARLYEMHVEQEDRLKAILYSTADGIIATDQNSRINLVNDAAARMLGIHATELSGVPLREAAIPVQIRDKLLTAVAPDAEPSERSFQTTLDNHVELSVTISPVHISSQVTSDDQMDGWVIVLRDITHLRRAELARVQFIQAAAHDMKNPLSVTQSSIRMIESMVGGSNDSLGEIIGVARTGIDRLHRLIDNLLQIEKIESGYEFSRDIVHVREMIDEISAQNRPLMRENGIEFTVEFDERLPELLNVDREWIKRAVHNLLENAAKYAGNNPVILRVMMENDTVIISVTDGGPGIPTALQSRIFDRFYRAEDRKDIRGSGLGLAIVKSVAEAHSGRAFVRSAEGQGSTIGLMLPLNENRVHHAS